MASYRPTIYGTRHAVSAGHYLATMAGFSILEAGGNAIDAGCTAGIALGILQPDLVNFAGVAPIILRLADGTVETIAGLGHWPRALDPQLFMREHGGKIPEGILRTVVPAAPDAWITALERHGTMTFGDVAGPARRFAAEGFAVNALLAGSIAAHEADYKHWPQNAAIFLPGGKAPAVGDKFVQSDLAKTIGYMIDQEKAAASRDAPPAEPPASPPRATRSIAATSRARSWPSTSAKADCYRPPTSPNTAPASNPPCAASGAGMR